MDTRTAAQANADSFRELRDVYADEAARREAARFRYMVVSTIAAVAIFLLLASKGKR
jgi:hypothetical protein